MPARFCDKDPCPSLEKAIHLLVPSQLTGDSLEFIVLPTDRAYPPQIVSFEYCPFCGTRIEPEWIEAAQDRGSNDDQPR